MRADDLRHALLLRAFELRAPDDLWPARDRTRVTDLAVEALSKDRPASREQLTELHEAEQPGAGNSYEPMAFIAKRARLATADLMARDPSAAHAFRSLRWRAWITPAVVVLGLLVGILSDALGPTRQINLLAPPLVGLILWNLLMLGALAVGGLVKRRGAAGQTPAFLGPLGALLERFVSGRDGSGKFSAQAQRFAHDWLPVWHPLLSNKIARAMHLGAAALAGGVLFAMYLRGLAFEYRAGWESTFLIPDQVHAVLHFLLTPASVISGIVLPDAQGVAELAFSAGPGENAAPWIHLWAITLGLFVIVPRLVLAAVAAFRSRALSANLPFDFDEPYFEGLCRILSGEAASLVVLPYGSKLTEPAQDCLKTSLQRLYGTATEITLRSTTAYGDEDDFEATAQDRQANRLVIVFSLSATPERENHGQFILNARDQFERAEQTLTLVDEAAFRARFPGNQDRLEQRRAAWRKLLRSLGQRSVFVQLEAEQIEASLDAMRDAHPSAGPASVDAAVSEELESR
ncbi:MAG: DUF2868 domain-containing protein [Burkholderiaceae bacterium]